MAIMEPTIESLKRLDLVDFLSRHYGLRFRRSGKQYCCHSPFNEEKRPSFFVHMVEGHRLFKDFSSGFAGSIVDFVQMREGLGSIRDTWAHIVGLISPDMMSKTTVEPFDLSGKSPESYDVGDLYSWFREQDISVCRDYLLGRGISEGLVHALISEGELVHNRYKGQSYCCFAVRDAEGRLKCLDNHQVDGPEKFVLGRKSIYSRDWEVLSRAEQVFVCEGIIDYLSVKTMEGDNLAGLALLGNQLIFDPELLGNARVLISALDHDRGGYGAFYDLGEQYPDKSIEPYDLEGRKDPNELLVAIKEGKGRRLSAEKKLKLYQEFIQTDNKAELARKWGLDRSYMYEIVRECEKSLLDTFAGRKPGRKPKGKPATLEEAWERIKELEKQYEQEATEKERLYCRSEFLKLRLQWSETEAAELRGEVVDESKGPVKKKQIKKKKKLRS
jgi:transposase-like protein